MRYALAEARSRRPGGESVLATLAEVLFIEVLRFYMNDQGEGRTGWLAGVGDRVVGAGIADPKNRPTPGTPGRSNFDRSERPSHRAKTEE